MEKFKWLVSIAGEVVGEVYADDPDEARDKIEKWLENLSVALPMPSGYWRVEKWQVKRLRSGDIMHSLFTLRVGILTDEGKYVCCQDYELVKREEETNEQKLLRLIDRLAKSGEKIADKLEKCLDKER